MNNTNIPFSIRPADEVDIAFILKGYQFTTHDNPMETTSILTADKIRQDILTDKPKTFIDIATYNGEAIAFVMYCYVYYPSTGQNIWVSLMYVDPFASRPGLSSVGKRLIDNIIVTHPETAGIYAITNRNNNAMQSVIGRYGGKIFEKFFYIGGLVNRDR
jgi:hypothetical protein